MTLPRPPDPAKLMFYAPAISPEEDWRRRSLASWVIMASHAGLEATPTDAGGKGFSGSWCGNVVVDGLIYRVHRGPRLRMAMLDEAGQEVWALHSATYVEPVARSVEVIDPRDDRPAADERPADRPREGEGDVVPDLRTLELPEAARQYEAEQHNIDPEPAAGEG